MDSKLRELFDCHLEEVLAQLPQSVHALLTEVPLHVEDYPSQQVLHELGLTAESNLCGVYSGVPLDQRLKPLVRPNRAEQRVELDHADVPRLIRDGQHILEQVDRGLGLA